MDMTTRYLGLTLEHPIIIGASPLCDDLDMVRRLEDAGAAALTLRSVFEEQLTAERDATHHHLEEHADAHAEARSYLPAFSEFRLGPSAYLEQLRRMKAAVKIPVVASLNGTTGAGWVEYAKLMQEAGADALELNLYFLATDPNEDAATVETRLVGIVERVRAAVRLPLAVKLSPFFSALPHLARRLDAAGASALVLFNRFYQPDIDVDALEVTPRLALSDRTELLLRLRWIAMLYERVRAQLCATGGVHEGVDVVKALMAGASAVQVVSAVLHHGPQRVTELRQQLTRFMQEREYESVTQLKGSMSLARCPDPLALERANYARILQTWRV